MDTIDIEKQIKDLHNEVGMLLKQGKSEDEIVILLEKKGVEPFYAKTILSNIEEQYSRRKNFWLHIGMGIGCCLGAAAFVLGTLQASNSNYIVVPVGMAGAGVGFVARAFVLYRR